MQNKTRWARWGAAALCLGALLPCYGAGLAMDRSMDEATARAMLSRFGYGATPESLAQAERLTPRQYLNRAIHQPTRLPASIQAQIQALLIAQSVDQIWAELGPGSDARRAIKDDAQARMMLNRQEGEYAHAAIQARLLTAANSDNPGHEALLSFWLNHFSIYAPKNLDRLLAWDYAQALDAAMAADSFEALLRASFFHPAMQFYLDNAQSAAPDSQAGINAQNHGKSLGINENLARELMELHTLGVGSGYTQADVQALAHIITGAGAFVPTMKPEALARAGATRMGLFLFDPRRHDFGEKHFLGQDFPAGEGLPEIDRALHLLATNPATAHHISLQLAQRFLQDAPPPALVDAMAHAFLQSGGKISATLQPLLSSAAFAESLRHPDKFKEPMDYVLSTARAACGDTPIGNGLALVGIVQDMGEAPFMHTTPDGYSPEQAAWLSPVTMAKRTRLAMGVAAQRIPLAAADPNIDTVDKPKGWAAAFKNGQACEINPAVVQQAVGPVGAATQQALAGLAAKEQSAVLLASPEFMWR